jgi:KaiC/GvpD/RAD55 family RecA-like ATPase
MLHEAKYLLSQGISVIPIQGRESNSEEYFKSPAFNWKEYQNRLPSMLEISKWFTSTRYNIAIVCGQISKIICFDIDSRHGGNESVKNYNFPKTWRDASPNGMHYYFRWHPEFNNLDTKVIGIIPGCDLQGNGSYIICPPSIGYKGQEYRWLDRPEKTPLAYPPSWLLDLIKKKEKELRIGNQQGWIVEALTNVKEGNRDNTFFKLAGRFWHDGLLPEEIIEILKPHAERVGYSNEELISKITQIQKYPRSEGLSIETTDDAQTIQNFMSSGESSIKWLVEGIIPEQSTVILGGLQGIGKTWLMLDLAIEMARGGGSWLGKFLVNPAKILYVDEESSSTLLRTRLHKLLLGKGVKISDLNLHLAIAHNYNFSSDSSVCKFKKLLQLHQPKVVFIDSLVRIHRGSENSSTELAQVFGEFKKLMREFNCTFIFADHEGKQVWWSEIEDKEPSSNDLRGSNEKAAFADSVLSLRRKKGELYLYHTKSRFAEAVLPIMVKISDTEIGKTEVRGY